MDRIKPKTEQQQPLPSKIEPADDELAVLLPNDETVVCPPDDQLATIVERRRTSIGEYSDAENEAARQLCGIKDSIINGIQSKITAVSESNYSLFVVTRI